MDKIYDLRLTEKNVARINFCSDAYTYCSGMNI